MSIGETISGTAVDGSSKVIPTWVDALSEPEGFRVAAGSR